MNKCTWIGNVRNMASLIGEKVKGKEIMVYNFCTNHLEGDQMLENTIYGTKIRRTLYRKT